MSRVVRRLGVLWMVLLLLLVAGCAGPTEAPGPSAATQPTPRPQATATPTTRRATATLRPTYTPLPTVDLAATRDLLAATRAARPTEPPPPPTQPPTQAGVPSGQAAAHVGEVVTVRIDRAHCAYRPDVGGRPTFCNDAPFPQHRFTLLVWDQDWSHLDGHCLLVRGPVSLYDGRPQIVLEDIGGVSYCP